MIAFASSLDQGGPIAQTAEDCGLLLNAMVGFDEKDSTSLDRKPEDFNRDLNKSIKVCALAYRKNFSARVWRGCGTGGTCGTRRIRKTWRDFS
jgi:aspartyl-tRNA(Asn)/glutamyl-tRNA(Gln) amidotransferase subunit A